MVNKRDLIRRLRTIADGLELGNLRLLSQDIRERRRSKRTSEHNLNIEWLETELTPDSEQDIREIKGF
jgi:hypothetical protein